MALTCEICGKNYHRSPSRVRTSRFCSVICRRKSRCNSLDILLKVAELYKQGLTAMQIAEQVDIGKSAICQYLKDKGLIRTIAESIRLAFLNGNRVSYWKGKSLPPNFKYDHTGEKASIQTKQKMRQTHLNLREKHPRWKTGLTSVTQHIRHSGEMKDWRMSIFERDSFRCLCCGQVGGDLEAHHILGFAQYSELRFVVNNGSTLCKQCHIELHYNKTRSQIA